MMNDYEIRMAENQVAELRKLWTSGFLSVEEWCRTMWEKRFGPIPREMSTPEHHNAMLPCERRWLAEWMRANDKVEEWMGCSTLSIRSTVGEIARIYGALYKMGAPPTGRMLLWDKNGYSYETWEYTTGIVRITVPAERRGVQFMYEVAYPTYLADCRYDEISELVNFSRD